MYKTKSMCWRGPPGSGKRDLLQKELQIWAKSIGQFYVVRNQAWNAPLQKDIQLTSTAADDGDDEDEKALFPMELSVLHWGFDISRMSLQDKQYIKSILLKWGRGSQVLSDGHVQRCLVLYHAHLLSSESIILLQAFLEENHHDTVVWMTSEHPLPIRLADWCQEVQVASPGYDISLRKIQEMSHEKSDSVSVIHLQDEIRAICKEWLTEAPKLSDVKRIRSIVYALLHRNIRWTDGFHQWLFAVESIEMDEERRRAVANVCIRQPFTGSGQTVPSYRIPILWEHYLCSLRHALAPAEVEPSDSGPMVKEPKEKKVRKNKKAV
jgi:hypothetical protein